MNISIADVKDLIGTPWRLGSANRSDGLGCWGLVREVLRRSGVSVPDPWDGVERTEARVESVFAALSEEFESARWIQADPRDASPGDVILFGGAPGEPSHAGVFLAGGVLIHSVRSIGVVAVPYSRVVGRAIRAYRRAAA